MYSFAIMKTPSDMKLARGRFVEGPVLGASVRHEVAFKKSKDGASKKAEGRGSHGAKSENTRSTGFRV